MDPSDDGKVINGSTIVWLHPPEMAPVAAEPGTFQNKGSAAAPAIGLEDARQVGGAVYTPQPKAAPAPPTPAEKKAQKAATANAAAASLKSAAESGVPFCEECEAARKKQEEEKQPAGAN
jgi:hypothetical protein